MSAARILSGTVTQTVADAFTQASVATALAGTSGVAFRILGITLTVPVLLIGAVKDLAISLCRRSQAAMPFIGDPEVLFLFERNLQWGTSVGFAMQEKTVFIPVPTDKQNEILIVEDPLFFMIDTTATAILNSAAVRLHFIEEKISLAERLALVERSIS